MILQRSLTTPETSSGRKPSPAANRTLKGESEGGGHGHLSSLQMVQIWTSNLRSRSEDSHGSQTAMAVVYGHPWLSRDGDSHRLLNRGFFIKGNPTSNDDNLLNSGKASKESLNTLHFRP
nr:hypothetical protein Iba_chr13aCG8380 [Ipomoea batatas]